MMQVKLQPSRCRQPQMTSPLRVTQLPRQLQRLRLRTGPVSLQRLWLQAIAPLRLRRLTAAGWSAHQTVRHHH